MSENFGEQLRRLRKERKITQRELAAATGLSASAIAFYETGGRTPSFEAAETLADYFNLSLSELVSTEVLAKEDGGLCRVKITINGTTVELSGRGTFIVEYHKPGAEGSFRI